MSLTCQDSRANTKQPYFLEVNPVQIVLNGLVLTNVGGQLYQNGVQVQNGQNWSLYPTLSNQIIFDSSNKLQVIDNYLYFDDQLIATECNISNVSDWYLYPALGNVELNANVGIRFNNILLLGTPTDLTYNNISILPSNWSRYNAITNVNMGGYAISNASTIASSTSMISPLMGDSNGTYFKGINLLLASNSNVEYAGQFCNTIQCFAIEATGISCDSVSQGYRMGSCNYFENNTVFGGLFPGGAVTMCQRADFYGEVEIHGSNFTSSGGNVLLDSGGLGTIRLTSDILGVGTARIDITLGGAIDITSAAVLSLTAGGALTVSAGGLISINGITEIINTTTPSNAELTFSGGGFIDMCNGRISNVSTINGATYPDTSVASNWANFPALEDVYMSNHSFCNAGTYNGITIQPLSNWSFCNAITDVTIESGNTLVMGNIVLDTLVPGYCNTLCITNNAGTTFNNIGVQNVVWSSGTSDALLRWFKTTNDTRIRATNGIGFNDSVAYLSDIPAPSNWSAYPAVSNVNMSSFSISNLSNINGLPFPTPMTPSNWSAYPAISNVNMSNFSISNLSNINGSAYPPPLVTLTGGNGISVGTGPNYTLALTAPVTDRAQTNTPVNITATTLATAQTILTLTLTTTFTANIDVNATFYVQLAGNTIYDLIYFLTLNGTQIGYVYKSSPNGTNHFLACPISAFVLNQVAGVNTIVLKAYAGSAPASGNMTIIVANMSASGNLFQD